MEHYYFQIDSDLVKQQRLKDNILIKRYDNNSEYAVLYFSSNGIYFPNDEKTFKQKIVRENKFEWTNPLNRIQKASINIYVRDLYKQWYIKGINNRVDSVEKMIDLFLESASGKKLITVGSSSGGYAATLFGILLRAEYIFNFCGQFNLYEHALSDESACKNPLVNKYRNEKKYNQYYDLTNLLENCKSTIFYFYSMFSEMDKKQYLLVKDYQNIYSFGIHSQVHGIPFNFHDLPNVLNSSKEELIELSNNLRGKTITTRVFTLKFSGLLYYMKVSLTHLIRTALPHFR